MVEQTRVFVTALPAVFSCCGAGDVGGSDGSGRLALIDRALSQEEGVVVVVGTL